MEMRYTVVNNDSSPHDVGIRAMLDTMIGGNDAAPFKIPGIGDVTSEQDFLNEYVPEWWQAFEDLSDPASLFAQGTLITGTIDVPDRFVLARWAYINDTPWDFTVPDPPRVFGDSATGIYWNPVTIQPGESKDFISYYGLSGAEVVIGPLIVVFNAINQLSRDAHNNLTPNPFAVTADIRNPNPQTANNVTATLTLGEGLIIESGDNPKFLGNLDPGAEIQASWQVLAIDEPPYGGRQLSVEVTATDLAPTTASRTVDIPTPNCVTGDADGDGDVDDDDVTQAEMIVVGLASLPAGCPEALVEVTCDGIFNSLDITGIEHIIMYGHFPCPIAVPSYAIQSAQLDIAYTLLSDKKTLIVTLNASSIGNLDIASFTLQFDRKAIRLVDVMAGTLTASGTPLVHTNNIGVTNVLMNLPGDAEISGDGSLMQMKFEMINESEHPQQIKLSNLLLGDNFARPISVNAKDFDFNFPQVPHTSQLLQNYPNPFNPETWIPYKLSDASDVVIKIYNVSGQTIRTLHLGHKDAGVYLTRERSAYWDGKNDADETIASGIYFYSIQAGKFTAVRRMVVVR
jgi:hypothetical protein